MAQTWQATSGSWGVASNWSGGSIPDGDSVSAVFPTQSGTSAYAVDLGGGTFTVNALQFLGSSAPGYSLLNGTLRLNGANPTITTASKGGGFSSATDVANLEQGGSLQFSVGAGAGFTVGGNWSSTVGAPVISKQGSGALVVTGSVPTGATVTVTEGAFALSGTGSTSLQAISINSSIFASGTISGGRQVTTNAMTLEGTGAGFSFLSVTGTGSKLSAGTLEIGNQGIAIGAVSNGAVIEVTSGTGLRIGSSGTSASAGLQIFGAGTRVTAQDAVMVGTASVADLTVQTRSTFEITGGSATLNLGRSGRLIFGGTPNTPAVESGSFVGSKIEGTAAGASIIFNHSGTVPLELGASLSGTLAITQTGPGTTRLTGANPFAGTFRVSSGTLVVNGSLTASDLTVSGTGRLSGDGSVFNLALQSGGRLLPGSSVGDLAITGDFTWSAGGAVFFDLGADSAASDILAITGQMARNGSGTYAFTFANAGWQAGQTYTLATFGGTNFTASDFSYTNTGGFQGQFSVSDNALSFELVAVPEPSVLALGLLGAGLLGWMARRRMRWS